MYIKLHEYTQIVVDIIKLFIEILRIQKHCRTCTQKEAHKL